MPLPSPIQDLTTASPGHSVPRVRRLAHVIQQGAVMGDTMFLNNIIDSVADPILVKDRDLRFLLVNQALCDFTGIAREDFIGKTDADLFPAEQAKVFNEMDRRVFASGLPNVNEEEHLHADGSIRTIRTTKTVFVDDSGKVLVGIFTDLTALRAAQRELEDANLRLQQLAHSDRLTGLPNRMSFEETLERTIAGARRHGETFAVLFMDLNGFKRVNDTYGHSVGDELIQGSARRLAETARGSDFVARLGGDEFVVIARSTDSVDAGRLAERLANELGRPQPLSIGEVSASVSIGIATYPRDGEAGGELIKNADTAMYRAKRITGQTFEFYDESQAVQAKRQFHLESQLRRDVEAGAIDVHFQPIVALDDARVLGFEALARWRHPQLGAISPDEFIAIAEQSRLIDRLGEVVLRKACDFIVRHGTAQHYVSVNVSSRQMADADFVAKVRQALQVCGAAPSQLALEVTESSLGSGDAGEVLQQLRDTGVMIFIDDFGVGYSNLMRLHELPFDVIKIDRGFVSKLGAEGGSLATAMIRTVMVLATELGLRVIAEGVETEPQARALRALGVRFAQGYLYGRPAPCPVRPEVARPASIQR